MGKGSGCLLPRSLRRGEEVEAGLGLRFGASVSAAALALSLGRGKILGGISELSRDEFATAARARPRR